MSDAQFPRGQVLLCCFVVCENNVPPEKYERNMCCTTLAQLSNAVIASDRILGMLRSTHGAYMRKLIKKINSYKISVETTVDSTISTEKLPTLEVAETNGQLRECSWPFACKHLLLLLLPPRNVNIPRSLLAARAAHDINQAQCLRSERATILDLASAIASLALAIARSSSVEAVPFFNSTLSQLRYAGYAPLCGAVTPLPHLPAKQISAV
jgi:hypothetical protein